ncbi:MAG TPA: glycosyltransferase [Polyangiaceae bacterium]|jgi:ceramide glucosyltransferase
MQLAVGLTLTSLTLYGTMMLLFARGMWARRRRSPASVDRAPRVTLFKPLAGRDDDLEANLESFAGVDYPSFEVLLGVASPDDPAFLVARRFVARHPKLDARVVVTDPEAAINPKVAQLVGLERAATGEVYVISDSNVRVRPGYLWSLVAELADPEVGVVTSLFAGTGERTLGAALENLQLCCHAAPGLLAMVAVSKRPLTVGKSMAIRRRDLAQLGGFLPVGGVLAEDYALGRRFLDAGFSTRTSLEPVENRNVGCSVARTFERHTRWSKMRRALYPAGFAFEPLMTPVVVASVGLGLAPGEVMAAVFGATCVVQTVAALTAVRVLRGSWLSWRYIPLEIVRSYVGLLCWMRACASRRIEWRGHAFTMMRGTRIVPAEAPHDRPDRARLAA